MTESTTEETTVEGDASEVVEAEETALVTVPGKTFGMLKQAMESFAPELSEDMAPEQRREVIRGTLRDSTKLDDKVYLVRGELLYELKENEYWKEYKFTDPDTGEERPYAKFDEYCQVELGISRRTAIYLCEIYKKCVVDLELPTDILVDLEWSKVKEVYKQVDADNYATVFDKLKRMSLKEATQYGKELRGTATEESGGESGGGSSDPTETFSKVTFKLAPEQHENISKALELAGKITGSSSKEHQMDSICSDFIASSVGGEGVDAVVSRLDVIIANLQRSFGVTLEISDFDSDRYASLEEAVAASTGGESESE